MGQGAARAPTNPLRWYVGNLWRTIDGYLLFDSMRQRAHDDWCSYQARGWPREKPATKPERAAAYLAWAAANRRNRNGENTADRAIRPLDVLMIKCAGTTPDQPINSLYLIEPNGQVSLGPDYWRVDLEGQTLDEAEADRQEAPG